MEDTNISALKLSDRGRSIVLHRDPADEFNHDVLHLWDANIDFQFVLDEYSTVMYICSYMMKSEKAMGEVLQNVARECRSDPIEQQLKKIGKAFVGKCVVSAPEAMRELSMWLIKKSRKVTFVNSNVCDEQVSLLKNSKMLDDMEEEDENVYATSIHDRYAAQPDPLENMCLAKFAVNYKPAHASCDDTSDVLADVGDSDDEKLMKLSSRQSEVIVLHNNLEELQKRKTEAVLWVRTYRQNTEPEKYYHSRLMI